jgi:hypothetical protein
LEWHWTMSLSRLNMVKVCCNPQRQITDVIEPCLLICVGANPILTFAKQDYESVETTVEQFENVCVNVWMQVVGDRSQEVRVEFC